VTVQTSPAGQSFVVDGLTYTNPQTFVWMSGFSHTIGVSSPQSVGADTRYVWSDWSDGGAMSHTITPTANSTNTVSFTAQYLLTMAMGVGGNGLSPATGFYDSGSNVLISTTASNGYAFSTWTGSGSGSNSGTNNPASVTMNGPITETASFTTIPVFRILSIESSGNDIRVTWQAAGGKTNVVQAAGSVSGAYTNISPNIAIPGIGDTTTNYLDFGAVTNWATRFYRIQLVE
jgi:hypothetical protein